MLYLEIGFSLKEETSLFFHAHMMFSLQYYLRKSLTTILFFNYFVSRILQIHHVYYI